jgi:glycosyltransferase involved in cell wall biosynthesis
MLRAKLSSFVNSLGLPWPPRWSMSVFECLFFAPAFFMAVAFELEGEHFGKAGIPLQLPASLGGITNFQPKLFPMEIFLLYTGLLTLTQLRKIAWKGLLRPLLRFVLVLMAFGFLRALPDLRVNPLLVIRNCAFLWYMGLPLMIALAPIPSFRWETFFRFLYGFSFAYFVLYLVHPIYVQDPSKVFWFIDLGLMFALAYGLCTPTGILPRVTLASIGFLLGLNYFTGFQRTTMVGLFLTLAMLLVSPLFFGYFPRPRWRRTAWIGLGLALSVASVAVGRAWQKGSPASLISEGADAIANARPKRFSENNENGLEKFRYFLWADAWHEFTTHPILGVGFLEPVVHRVYAGKGAFWENSGSFEGLSQGNKEKVTPPLSGPHNSYLNALARMGILGLGILFLHLACAWVFLTRCYFACFFILLWQMLYAFFNVSLEGPIRSFPLLLLLGAALKLAVENFSQRYDERAEPRGAGKLKGSTARRVGVVHVPYRLVGGEDRHVALLREAYRAIGIEPVSIPPDDTPADLFFNAARSLTAGNPAEWDALVKRHGIEFLHINNIHALLGPAFLRWVIERKIPALMTVHNHRFYCTNGLALYGTEVCKACRPRASFLRPIVRNCNASLPKTIYHSAALTEIRGDDLLRRSITHFLAPSPYVARELQVTGVAPRNLRLFPHPVSVSGVGQAPGEKIDVAFVGRLSTEKGVEKLLGAARKLPARRFAVVGEGPLENEVREAVRSLPNVRFLGKMSRGDALAVMKAAKVVCVPSLCHESFSLVAAEALSLGARLVVPDTQSFLHYAESPFDAVTAVVTNPESLAYSIETALEQPRRGEAEVAALRDRFGVEAFQNRLRAVVDEVIYEGHA